LFWYEKINNNLFIKAQFNIIPWSREIAVIGVLNHLFNRYNVLIWARLLGFNPGQRIMWIYDTEAAEYLSAFKNDKVVYDCVDDHAAQAGVDRNPVRVQSEEEKIMTQADLVTVSSRHLLRLKQAKNPNVKLVLNAADTKLFGIRTKNCPVALHDIKKPIVGSVGALDEYKVDFELLYRTAKSRPEWSFVFIGSPVVDSQQRLLNKLRRLNNVHLLGTIDKTNVPQYVHCFNVCLIPYRANKYNAASFPLKFWEFMATGKPIVVTGVPELKKYRPLIGYAKKLQEFISEIERGISYPETSSAKRVQLAKQHDWQDRVSELRRLVAGLPD
jgi:glycosyltransferase involved in cell wall biosynthesis